MKRLLMCLALLIAAPLAAENVGGVEYQLPSTLQHWKVANQMQHAKTTTIIYTPDKAAREEVREFFGVNANEKPLGKTDEASLTKALEMQFPDGQMQIQVKILKREPQSVLYEWSAKQQGQEKVHGWSRAFTTPQGSVVLGYITEQTNGIDAARRLWLPVLETAKLSSSK